MSCFKVNVIGAPSSGKTTLCTGIEYELKSMHVNVDSSREYARQYINVYGWPETVGEQFILFENQDRRDIAIAEKADILLSDSPGPVHYVFGVQLLKSKLKDYTKIDYKFLEELFIKCLQKTMWFDLILVLNPLDFVTKDGTRKEEMADIYRLHDALIGFLNLHQIPYVVLDGTLKEKVEKGLKVIMEKSQLKK